MEKSKNIRQKQNVIGLGVFVPVRSSSFAVRVRSEIRRRRWTNNNKPISYANKYIE